MPNEKVNKSPGIFFSWVGHPTSDRRISMRQKPLRSEVGHPTSDRRRIKHRDVVIHLQIIK